MPRHSEGARREFRRAWSGRTQEQVERPTAVNPTVGARADLGAGVYAGSTSLSFQVFGRHLGRGDSLERRGFARPGASSGDT